MNDSRLKRTIASPRRAWNALNATPVGSRRLYYGRPSSARRTLLLRLLATIALVVLVVVVFLLDRDGLQDNIDGHVSVIDVIYFSMVTITTVGYGDIVPVTESARLFDALLVTPIRLVVWLIFLGTAYQFVVQRIVEDLRMRIRQSDLKNHTVLCGFGLSGRSAVTEMLARGADPARIVVIDADEAAVLHAAELGLVGMRGDATREATLKDARVAEAKTAIVALGRDDTSVLSVLTLRALAPRLRVVAMVKEAENESLLRQGGASATICVSTIGGALMANSLEDSEVARYMMDMLTSGGRVMFKERIATAVDIGRVATALADGIALRILRGDRTVGFWEPEASVREGDRLLVISPQRVDV